MPALSRCAVLPPLTEVPGQVAVLTWNLEGAGEAIDLDAVAAALESAAPDVVALQGLPPDGEVAALLAQRTGMQLVSDLEATAGRESAGNAFLSRWPLQAVEQPILAALASRPPPVLAVRMGHLELVTWNLAEVREADGLAAVRSLEQRLAQRGAELVVLAGSFGAEPPSALMRELFRDWASVSGSRYQATFPAPAPFQQLDYVLVRPRYRWQVVEARVLEPVSGIVHLPLLGLLELRTDL